MTWLLLWEDVFQNSWLRVNVDLELKLIWLSFSKSASQDLCLYSIPYCCDLVWESVSWSLLPISECLIGDYLQLFACIISVFIFCTFLVFPVLLITRFLYIFLSFIHFMALPNPSSDLQQNSFPLWWIWLVWGPWLLVYLRLQASGELLPTDGFVHEKDILNLPFGTWGYISEISMEFFPILLMFYLHFYLKSNKGISFLAALTKSACHSPSYHVFYLFIFYLHRR